MCQTPDEVSTVLCVLMLSVPLRWIWLLLSHNTAVYLESDHYCATLFSSFVFSNLFWHTLSLALSFCPPPPHLAGLFSPGAPEGYKCSSASPQYELIPNLAARRSERKIDTKTHHLQKQVEECRTKYSYRKNIYKEDVTGSKHRVALFCWNKTLLIRTFPNPWTTL